MNKRYEQHEDDWVTEHLQRTEDGTIIVMLVAMILVLGFFLVLCWLGVVTG